LQFKNSKNKAIKAFCRKRNLSSSKNRERKENLSRNLFLKTQNKILEKREEMRF